MKKSIRLTLIASVVLIVLSTTVSAKVPEGWLNGAANFEKAMQLHRTENVPLVVYFYVDWCPYCNALESEYFPAAAMRDYLRDVVKIRINPESTRADEDVARAFGIRGYPGFFVIGPGSFPVQLSPFRRDGRSLTPAEFAQRCRDVTTPRNANGARFHARECSWSNRSRDLLSDWRYVDGFRLPCSMTQMIGNLSVVVTIDEIKHNVTIDEAVFQRPAR
jgi:thiol-disulfide isomerase/thioredoxin